jgi:hypothetical protein
MKEKSDRAAARACEPPTAGALLRNGLGLGRRAPPPKAPRWEAKIPFLPGFLADLCRGAGLALLGSTGSIRRRPRPRRRSSLRAKRPPAAELERDTRPVAPWVLEPSSPGVLSTRPESRGAPESSRARTDGNVPPPRSDTFGEGGPHEREVIRDLGESRDRIHSKSGESPRPGRTAHKNGGAQVTGMFSFFSIASKRGSWRRRGTKTHNSFIATRSWSWCS